MPVTPSRDMPTFLASAAQIAAPMSSNGLAAPLQIASNHLLGYVMRGVIHYQWRPATPTDGAETGRFYTYRNPNCDYLYCWALLEGVADNTATLTVTTDAQGDAGGPTATVTTRVDADGAYEIIAPWDPNDSGYLEVTWTTTSCAVRAIMIGELYRQELGAGDDYVAIVDSTSRRGGLLESTYAIQAADSGVNILVTASQAAWDNAPKQAVSWCTTTDDPYTDAGSWTNPLANSFTFTHQARANVATGGNSTDYTVWAYTKGTIVDPGIEYSWRVTSGSDSVTKTGLTNVTYEWTYVTGLAIDNTAGDTLTFEMQIDAGTGNAYVAAISVVEGTYSP